MYIAIHRLAPFILSYSEENVFLLANLSFSMALPFQHSFEIENQTIFISAQSTTSTTFLTHRLNLRRARTIPTTQTIDPMLPIQGWRRERWERHRWWSLLCLQQVHMFAVERGIKWHGHRTNSFEMSFRVNFQQSFKRIDDRLDEICCSSNKSFRRLPSPGPATTTTGDRVKIFPASPRSRKPSRGKRRQR